MRRPLKSDDAIGSRARRARAVVWATIIVGGTVALWGRYHELSDRNAPLAPEIAAPQSPAPAQPAADFSPAPEVRFLLGHQRELKLTDLQRKQLGRLQALWVAESRPMRDEASQVVRSASSQAKPRQAMQDIQAPAAPVTALSADLAATRRKYWTMATSLLTEEQKQRLKPLLKQVTLADLLPASSAQARQPKQPKETRKQ